MSKPLTIPQAGISQELAFLIRGFFATPVISALTRLGVFERMLQYPEFNSRQFPFIKDSRLLEHTFKYLARVGLLENRGPDLWSLTDLGRQIFQRASSFYVPHSYHEYMETYFAQLTGSDSKKPAVERNENILGSGKTHLRYFPFATSFLKRRVNFEVILDIGCGDGKFLNTVLTEMPGKVALGVDYSEISVKTTAEKMKSSHPSAQVEIVCSDAFLVKQWGPKIAAVANGRKTAISMWFLIHEISANDPARIVEFLNKVHGLFPESPLIICEIVRHEDAVLAASCKESIMPEYLFFHDISGQGVLSWTEYNEILAKTPYKIQMERLFDEIPDSSGRAIPSSFVWCLAPEKS